MCGVPRSTLKKWRQQYLNGLYTEVTNDDIELFRDTSWRSQQEIMAHQAFGAAKKTFFAVVKVSALSIISLFIWLSTYDGL